MAYREIDRPTSQVHVAQYHFVDCYDFFHPPTVGEYMHPCTPSEAEQAFRAAGYFETDIQIGLVWLPPFLWYDDNVGVCLWHAKQDDNGTSWLCAQHPMEFAGLQDSGCSAWKKIVFSQGVASMC